MAAGSRARRGRVAALAGIAALAAAVGCGGDDERPIPDGPNVVIITTDDQSMHSFRRSVMPRTFELLVDRGTELTTGIAAPPLCCPSRAGLITGEYPHNHGVFSNEPGYEDLREPENVLPVWLHDAGYRTGLVGKYLNGTVDVLGGEPAPGWDDWFEIEDLSYFGATAFDQGEPIELGDAYTPAVINERAVDFIEDASGERPFFLWLSQTAPHSRSDEGGACPGKSPQPLPADLREFRDAPLPRSPSFNEADVSDKPAEVAGEKRLTAAEERTYEEIYRCTAATLQEVDRGVAQVWNALEREGEANDTVILFHSDNGLFFGEHRVRKQKGQVYEPALRVPMAMRVPQAVLGAEQRPTVADQVTNLDIAPTVLELTGVEPCPEDGECRVIDGRSIAELLRGKTPEWAPNRGVLIEQGITACKYAAIRTRQWLYNQNFEGRDDDGECVEGEPELYDLRRDPDELENLAGRSPARGMDLAARLAALRACAGTSGPQACE